MRPGSFEIPGQGSRKFYKNIQMTKSPWPWLELLVLRFDSSTSPSHMSNKDNTRDSQNGSRSIDSWNPRTMQPLRDNRHGGQ